MGELSLAKSDAVAAMMRDLPDDALMTLKLGMSADGAEAWMAPIRRAVEAQLNDRRLRDVVLQILVRAAADDPLRGRLISRRAVTLVWQALHAEAADGIAAVASALADRDSEGAHEALILDLCAFAVRGLPAREGAFASAAEALSGEQGGLDGVLRVLMLAPFVRSALPRARGWLRGGGGAEEASCLRLAVRDASALLPEGGPLLIDLLSRHFDQPSVGIRLVSAVMDRPAEVFLARTEFAPLAQHLVDHVDAAVARLKRAGEGDGRAHGAGIAAQVEDALHVLGELAHAVQLDREKPWGRRVAAQRRDLAMGAERWLKQADGLVAAALPVQASRAGLSTVQGAPTLREAVQPAAVARAEAALAFLDGVRRGARDGGFGVLHGRVVDAIDMRLDTYIDDLLAHMQTDGQASSERLLIAADFLGMVRDPAAAQIVRRRMAAAA